MANDTDVRFYQALFILQHNDHGKILLEHLQAELEKERKSGDTISSEVEMRWNQGRCQALQGLIDKFRSSGQILDRMRENGKQLHRI